MGTGREGRGKEGRGGKGSEGEEGEGRGGRGAPHFYNEVYATGHGNCLFLTS